jgi:hypothetical protein
LQADNRSELAELNLHGIMLELHKLDLVSVGFLRPEQTRSVLPNARRDEKGNAIRLHQFHRFVQVIDL